MKALFKTILLAVLLTISASAYMMSARAGDAPPTRAGQPLKFRHH
ncbi:hypothetical protein QUF72_15835 [Desulfobacterales bacterium HSG2]|nr:hypothetical protein [Desulfobacterales bacterium HSG2]